MTIRVASALAPADPSLAVDGMKDPFTSVPFILIGSQEPWMAIDFGKEEFVAYVHIYNHPISKYLSRKAIILMSDKFKDCFEGSVS